MKKTNKTLEKCDALIDTLTQLKKALGGVTSVASSRKPVNGLGTGWSQDPGTGALHHSTHGVISTRKHPEGGFEVRHGGGVVGRTSTIGEAGAHIKNYIGGLGSLAPTKKAEEAEKSDYGKFKGGSQYDAAANAKRKAGNIGADKVGTQSVKAYSKNVMAPKVPKGPAGPVKQYTPEQIAAINEANKLKKTAENLPWVTHGSVPNADREVQLLRKTNPAIPGEDAMAGQLANMMNSRAMMRPDHRQPTSEDMIMAGQVMGIAPSEEQVAKAEQQWGGAINNWLAEASKPISQRFASEEEEMAYWHAIPVRGNDKPE
jgi:hypothetical protein